MRLIAVVVFLLAGCDDDAAEVRADAAPVVVDAGLVSGCRTCERTADCSGYQCVDGTCLKPCQTGAECFPSGSSTLECTSFGEDAGFYCVGGPDGCP